MSIPILSARFDFLLCKKTIVDYLQTTASKKKLAVLFLMIRDIAFS